MDTTLTRRGRWVAGLAGACLLIGAVFGARSLNAVVAPIVVALLAAIVLVHRADPPVVERTVPPDSAPGEIHPVRLDVEGTTTAIYELEDRVPRWLYAPEASHVLTEENADVEYDLHYERRGVHQLGPLSVGVTDVLGLARREIPAVGETDAVLVHPELVEPPAALRSSLATVVDLERRPGRDEFDRLREYVRGDSPRDIHWKSSAKRTNDDLVVKEFLGRSPTDAVRIAVSAEGDRATVDGAARAAASVAEVLLEEGVDVGLETPAASLQPGVGESQRAAILAALARLEAGEAEAPDATINVEGTSGTTTVSVGGETVVFDRGVENAVDQPAPADGADQPGHEEVVA